MARKTYESIAVAQSLAPAARTASANGTAATADDIDARTVTAYVQVDGWTDGTHTFSFEDEIDDGAGSPDGGSWTAVPAGALIAAGPAVGAAGGPHYFAAYIQANRPHVRVVQTVTGGPATGAVIGAWLIFGDGDVAR